MLKNNLDIENIVKSTIKKTLIIVPILLFMSFIGFSFFTPSTMASVTNNMGWDRLTLSYYEFAYSNREDDMFLLYKIINKSNDLSEYTKVSEYFNKIYNNGDELYYKFVNEISDKNISKNRSPINLEFISNEDRIIKRIYIRSILNLGEKQKAFDFVTKDFENKDLDSEIDIGLDLNIIPSVYLNYAIENNKDDLLEKFNNDEDFFYNIENFYQNLNYFYQNEFNYNENTENLEKKLIFINNLVRFSEFLLAFSQIDKFDNELDYFIISDNYLDYLSTKSDIIQSLNNKN